MIWSNWNYMHYVGLVKPTNKVLVVALTVRRSYTSFYPAGETNEMRHYVKQIYKFWNGEQRSDPEKYAIKCGIHGHLTPEHYSRTTSAVARSLFRTVSQLLRGILHLITRPCKASVRRQRSFIVRATPQRCVDSHFELRRVRSDTLSMSPLERIVEDKSVQLAVARVPPMICGFYRPSRILLCHALFVTCACSIPVTLFQATYKYAVSAELQSLLIIR